MQQALIDVVMEQYEAYITTAEKILPQITDIPILWIDPEALQFSLTEKNAFRLYVFPDRVKRNQCLQQMKDFGFQYLP